MIAVRVTRTLAVPDPVRLARYRKSPELGPRIVFFSGGTALRETSRHLIQFTHQSQHLITPFDSGGSSATLRRAFDMPAVGDVRNRLMAVADQSVHGNPEIYGLFASRLPTDVPPAALRDRLIRMAEGSDPAVAAVPQPLRRLVQHHLEFFLERMPATFDLRGANVGNLILTGGYLNQRREIEPVLFLFSRLVEARAGVRPVVDANLHLAAELQDGRTLVGQHVIAGRNGCPLPTPVERLFLVDGLDSGAPTTATLSAPVRDTIGRADLICFPIGSFYTSLVATLLPDGVGEAIARADVPKVYVPNTGHDPEQLGLDLARQVETLLHYLRRGARGAATHDASRLLTHVLVDSRRAGTAVATLDAVRSLGVTVVDLPLVTDASAPLLDGRLLAESLVCLA
jgi:CofD-related protein of GAK system